MNYPDTLRVLDLRRRLRAAMGASFPAERPERIEARYMSEPLIVRKARAIVLRLDSMSPDLWSGQLFAGSIALEKPHPHSDPCQPGGASFPDYRTEQERAEEAIQGTGTASVFAEIVPDYRRVLAEGLHAIMVEADAQRPSVKIPQEQAILDAVQVALQDIIDHAHRLAVRSEHDAILCDSPVRAAELYQMRDNLRQVPSGRAETFWQALQSVWLLYLAFNSAMDGEAIERLDQYAWPYLKTDMDAGRLTIERAAELVSCFCLKFNEGGAVGEDQAAKAHQDQATASTGPAALSDSAEAANLLTYLLREAYRRNQMPNPGIFVRLASGGS